MSGRLSDSLARLLERIRPIHVQGDYPTDADEVLRRRLAAFGTRELSASDETLQRIQGEMAAAFLRATRGTAERPGAAPHGEVRQLALGPFRLHQPATVIALFAMLFIGLSSVTVAESGPGHLFYRARLAVETLTLPAKDSEDRVEAQLARLTLRLNEADEAGRHGDVRAVGEAMEAYRQTLNEVVELCRSHPSKIELAVSMLGRNLDALRLLSNRVPADGPTGVGDAIAQTIAASRAIDPTR
jgi:hypothetical protein